MSQCVLATIDEWKCNADLPKVQSASSYCQTPNGSVPAPCANPNAVPPLAEQPAPAGQLCYWCAAADRAIVGASTPSSSSSAVRTGPSAIVVGSTVTPVTTKPASTPTTTSPISGLTIGTTTPSVASGISSDLSKGSIPTTSAAVASSTSAGNKISGGAAAGIGIGGVLVGALLAGLVTFFLLRRRRGGSTYSEEASQPSNPAYFDRDLKNGAVTVAPVKGGVISNIDRLLPQPAEDDAIIGGLSKIRDGIKNHVQNYYHTSPVGPDVVDEAKLVELAHASNIPSAAILGLLLNPATRISTIRLLLAHLILSRCIGRVDGQPSLLPLEVSLLAGNPFANSHTALFSKWKTISGVLLQPYGEKLSENDARIGSIKHALAVIEPILNPFISANTDMGARQRNLEGILSRAAQFAFLLFAQPGSFVFDFTGTGQPDSLVVFPALLQTVDDEAGAIVPPRFLSEKEVVRGLGA